MDGRNRSLTLHDASRGVSRMRREVTALLEPVGIRIDGSAPWDIRIRDERFFARVLADGSLGLGESYMDGWWECDRLDELTCRIVRNGSYEMTNPSLGLLLARVQASLFNLQGRLAARRDVRSHYDLGNDLYRAMLDRRMMYTCGYWKQARTLDEAQEAKIDLACRKIGLETGMRVLDIGCGWGGFARFAAERCGASVVGVTLSEEQAIVAREVNGGLPVEIRVQDYRDVDEPFDRIVSFGMVEHVGPKNLRGYMKVARRCLKEDGLFLLHSIGSAYSMVRADPWMDRHVFPGAVAPSIRQFGEAFEKIFIMEDWHNFGADYDPTLRAWFDNFDRAWPSLQARYGDAFYRRWKYYLLATAGYFRSREGQLWQIVLSPKGVAGGYRRPRD